MKRSSLHSLAKAFSWRIFATVITVVISYIITHKISFALYIGAFECVTKIILFYLHERLWETLYASRSHPPAALKVTFRVLRNILKYLSGITALEMAPEIAKNKGLAAATSYLSKQYRFFRPASVRFLKKLYCYLQTLDEASRSDFTKTENKLHFMMHFCCWGTAYLQKVEQFLLPSLLADENVPWISKRYQVSLSIHCDRQAQEHFLSMPVMLQLQQYVTVQFFLIPDSLIRSYQACLRYPNISYLRQLNVINSHVKYLLLGGMQAHALKLALREKAVISFLMPDLLFSNAFFKEAFKLLQQKKLVLATSYRTHCQTISQPLARFYNQNHTVLSIEAKTLADLQVKHIHPIAKRQIVSGETTDFVMSAQLVFKTPKGYVIRSFHYHPVLLDCAHIPEDIQMDYFPIDNAILKTVLSEGTYEKQLSVVDDASVLSFIEISDEGLSQRTTKYQQQVTLDDIAQACKKMLERKPEVYNMPYNWYLVHFKYKIYAAEPAALEHYHGHPDDEAFFEALSKAIAT